MATATPVTRLTRALTLVGLLAALALLVPQAAQAQNEPDDTKLNPILRVALLQGGAQQARAGLVPMSAVTSPTAGYEVFIRGPVTRAELEAVGVQVRTDLGDIKTAFIPEASLAAVTHLPSVTRVEGAVQVETNHSLSVPATGASSLRGPPYVFAGLNGLGIVVGDVDSGVDWTHPDFITNSGFSRILRIWDQTDAIGPPPGAFGYGSEWSNVDIDNGLCREVDTDGHGSHVLGSIGGDGSHTGNGRPAFQYNGMAPRADLMMVKTTFFTNAVVDGVDYIFQQAGSTPAVVNLSLGSQYGPHDGTSTFEQALNLLSGHGRLVTKSAGNDNNSGWHAEVFATPAAPVTARLLSSAAGNGAIAVTGWYDQADNVTVQLITPNGTVVGPVTQGNTAYQNVVNQGTIYIENGATPSNSGDHEIYLQFDSSGGFPVAAGNWDIRVVGVSVPTGGEVDLWRFYSSVPSAFPFFSIGLVNDELVGEPGNADSVCTVGAWTTRKTWIAIDGGTYNYTGATNPGFLAPFSSPGPTRDGRLKPDITAPGTAIISVKSAQAAFPAPLIDRDGVHAILQGTSMSAPHAAGAVALIMQSKGALWPSQVKQIIQNSALSDFQTGAVPNNVWGWGKLNLEAPVPAALRMTVESGDFGVQLAWSVSGEQLRNFQAERRIGSEGSFLPLNSAIITSEVGGNTQYSLVDTEILAGLTYQYQIKAANQTGELVTFGPYVAKIPAQPKLAWGFAPPSPNPMSLDGVQFAYTAAQRGQASLIIYDARGREVARPLDSVVEPGAHSVAWNGRAKSGSRLPSGIYLVVFRGGNREIQEKLVLLD
jgi:minor extracellular serine protease Vpr